MHDLPKTQLVDIAFKLFRLEQLVGQCGEHEIKVIRDLAVLKTLGLFQMGSRWVTVTNIKENRFGVSHCSSMFNPKKLVIFSVLYL